MREIIINVKVNPNSSKNELVKIDDQNFRLRVINPPVKGRANKEVIETLAEYFKVPNNQVEILRGATGSYKIIKIVL